MPAPRSPATLDGLPLSPRQQARLQRLMDLLWAQTPTRDPEAISAQATGAFRATVGRRAGAWFDRATMRLADGAGPVLVLR